MVTEKKEKCNQILQFQEKKNFAKKIQNKLSELYFKIVDGKGKEELIPSARSEQIKNCGSLLQFETFLDKNGTTTLKNANFCKHKLCPFCAWRWHLKNSAILDKTFELLKGKQFYHLVLTIPNTKYLTKDFLLGLRERASKFLKKYLRCDDYFNSFEITIDKEGNYHPHYHVVGIFERHFGRKELQTNWAKYANCGTNYAICKMDKCNGSKVALELTKYILKFENPEITKKHLFILNNSTKGIRKFSTSGIVKTKFEEAKRLINEEEFAKLQNLTKYDSFISFYKWFGSSYEKTDEILVDRGGLNEFNKPTN